jgi:hypothetical protein
MKVGVLIICKVVIHKTYKLIKKANGFDFEYSSSFHLRAALHLEAGPICCVRGLKSSLVIGQKAQIGPNPFTPRSRADLVVCYDTAQAR